MLFFLLLLKLVAAHDSELKFYSTADMASGFFLLILILACFAGVWASANTPTEQSRVIHYVIDEPKTPSHSLRYHRVEEC
jgi:hypothetical protein